METYFSTFSLYGILFLALFYITKRLKSWTSPASSRNFPRGPRALPVIGNLHMINLSRPSESLMKLSKKYGSVFSIRLGSEKIVVLSGYEAVKSALVDYADDFSERPYIPMFEDIHKASGIPFNHGESWKTIRRFTIATLRDFGMGKRTIEDRIIEECGYFIKVLEPLEGEPTDLTLKTNFAVGNIIMSIVLGQRFDYQDPTFSQLLGLINENMKLVISPSVAIYNAFPLFYYYLSSGRRKVMQNIDNIQAFFKILFAERLQKLDKDDPRGYIDAFLIKQQEEKSNPNTHFHELNLLTAVTALFMAGTDTTSSTIRWAISFMVQHPDIQKRVHEEIDKVVGSAKPRIEHRKDMPYTNAVVHETQRCANIVPANLPRATTKDVIFQGYHFPKGTYVIPLLESVLYDETQFENAESFKPERFLDSKGVFVKRAAFMPFSAGRRICVGETLAKMELFLFFTSAMQKFTFQAAPGVNNFHVKPGTGLTNPPVVEKICCFRRS